MTISVHALDGPRANERLERRRAELMAEISTASRDGNAQAVLGAAIQLRELEAVFMRIRDLEADLARILEAAPLLVAPVSASVPRSNAKANGAKHRAAFLARARQGGVVLTPKRGTIFESPRGRQVGTAIASELHDNRWLFGLPAQGCESAALVCIARSGDHLDLCLPKTFLDSVAALLSCTAGQLKLNVLRRDQQLLLKLPHRSPVALDEYVNAYAGLDT